MSRKIEISIVTVGMNHLNHLKAYLQSLFVTNKPKTPFELIYVDNCSSDGSVHYIRDNFPEVKIIENRYKKGFASNNNLGVKRSVGKYVLILNPDIILSSNAVDKMYNFLEGNQQVGVVVPKLLNPDLTVQLSVRKFMNFRTVFCRALYNMDDEAGSRTVRNYLLKDFDTAKVQSIDWALGAAMLMSRKWFDRLGGFDEKYFLYVEDVDLCMRSWKRGKAVIYLPEAVMIHAHQKASRNGWNKKRFIHLKSMCRFFVKHNILFKRYNFTSGELLRVQYVK